MMSEDTRNYRYFELLSNEVNALFEALSLFHSKGIVIKGFASLKKRLNSRKFEVSSELALNGKIFVKFKVLIYLCYIKKDARSRFI